VAWLKRSGSCGRRAHVRAGPFAVEAQERRPCADLRGRGDVLPPMDPVLGRPHDLGHVQPHAVPARAAERPLVSPPLTGTRPVRALRGLRRCAKTSLAPSRPGAASGSHSEPWRERHQVRSGRPGCSDAGILRRADVLSPPARQSRTTSIPSPTSRRVAVGVASELRKCFPAGGRSR
jgi:hypothetical protein